MVRQARTNYHAFHKDRQDRPTPSHDIYKNHILGLDLGGRNGGNSMDIDILIHSATHSY